MYVGRQCDPFFYQELFQVNDYHQVNKNISEDEMFANTESSNYLTALSGIINQIRYTRQPFCELIVLLAGESESESTVAKFCICDENSNTRYRIDYNKFMVKVQQSASSGGGSIGTNM